MTDPDAPAPPPPMEPATVAGAAGRRRRESADVPAGDGPADADPVSALAGAGPATKERERREASASISRTEPIAELADDRGDAAAMFRAGFADRYLRGELLGAGGMGEVRSFVDQATGRTIAMKTIRGDIEGPAALRRFAREARIQAQLEHPAIPPVYDVGVGDDDALYFTMKQIRGDSLATVLTGLRAGNPDVVHRFSTRKLLTVLSSVAMTLEYAHQRGVIHRDLKPANIMLGGFGEVYVLDWGLADLRDRTPSPGPMPSPIASGPVNLARLIASAAAAAPLIDSSQQPDTATGLMLGTPGYVAPELLGDHSDRADHRCDIYALGAILFEIVTLEKLHPGSNVADVLTATVSTDGVSPRLRAPLRQVAPELDELCVHATRLAAADRPSSALAVARALEAFLDGDRDLDQRRKLAARSAEVAAVALTRAQDPAGDETAARSLAMREVATALGLDPANARARGTLIRLLTEPAREAPRAADQVHHEAAVRAFRLAGRNAIFAMCTYALYVPLLLAMGIRHWWMFGVMAAAILGVIGLTYHYYRRPPADLRLPLPHLMMTTAALASGVTLFGPLVLLPAIVIATGVGYLASFGRRGLAVTGAGVLIVLVPMLLQLAGVIPRSYAFVDGTIQILPVMASFPPAATIAFLIVTHVVVIATALLYVWRLRLGFLEAERRLRLQAWHLAQIVPEDARGLLSP